MANTFPRVYKYGPVTTAVTGLCGLLFLGGAAALAVLAPAPKGNAWLIPVICTGLVALGLVVLWSLMGRTTLYEDRLEYRGLIATRRIARTDIVRTRNARSRTVSVTLVLVLKSGRSVQVSDFGRMDDVFKEWFNAFPNAEVEARVARKEKLRANPAFGSNPTEREHHIKADARFLSFIGWPCIALSLWGMIWPQPYTTCLSIVATLPVLVLIAVAASRGRWALIDGEDVGRLNTGQVMLTMPCYVMVLRAIQDGQLLNWWTPIIWAAGAAVVLTGLSGLAERRLSRMGAVGLLLLWWGYAWGTAMFVNRAFDTARFEAVPVQVLGLEESSHDQTATVSGWRGHSSPLEVNISYRFYAKLHKGDHVCLHIHPGLLHWPWHVLGFCPAAPR